MNLKGYRHITSIPRWMESQCGGAFEKSERKIRLRCEQRGNCDMPGGTGLFKDSRGPLSMKVLNND